MTVSRSQHKLFREIFGLRLSIAVLVLLLVALPLFYLEARLGNPWSTITGGFAGALAPVALITIVYETWLRRAAADEFRAAAEQSIPGVIPHFQQGVERANVTLLNDILSGIGVSDNLRAAGVKQVGIFSQIDWRGFFAPGEDIDICVGYGKSWSGNWAYEAVLSTARQGRRVRVTLLDPNGPAELLRFYAPLWGAADADELRARIYEAQANWRDAVRRVKEAGLPGRVTIEGLHRHVPYTFYTCANSMWIVFAPRRAGRAPEKIPAVLCKPTDDDLSLFRWAMEDMDACRRDGDVVLLEEVE